MEAEAEAEAIFENHLEAEAEAEALVKKILEVEAEAVLKKIWVEAEVEANFFSSWRLKRKLLNSFRRVEAEAESVENF